MTEDVNTAPVEAPAWESARTVWSAGGVDLPATMNSNNAHFLADLKRAAANFRSAKTVSDMDRERDWSFDELADRCRDLSDALSRMDTVASARITGASPVSFTPLVGETIANLDMLEAAVKHAQAPLIPPSGQAAPFSNGVKNGRRAELLGIYFFFSFFCFRFSFRLRKAFFCCSLLPLSFFPYHPYLFLLV